MKKIILGIFLSMSIGGGVAAQEAPPSDFVAGNIACFDYYKFGSVQADLQPNLAQTVPGASLTFSGKVVNDNEYPLVDGKLFVKIFKRSAASFSQEDGNPVVDQFVIEEDMTLPAKGSKDASFEWQVPSNAAGGEYYAAYFFTTSNRYNLMGLSFTDDIVGNQASFMVTTTASPQVVELQKNTTTLNGRDHKFANFPLHFGAEEQVILKTTLSNNSDQTKTVPLQWNQYAWDDQNEINRRNTQTELITLAPRETKEVSYEAKPQKDAIVYIVATTQDGESKSFLNVRYVKDGVPETRINFPSLTKFPLKEGEENVLFGCAHATNENMQRVQNNTLILTLKDREGEVIHQYLYKGWIAASMSGFGEKFIPQKNYDYVTLEAQLFRDGSEMESVTVTYDCNEIDPQTCSSREEGVGEAFVSDKFAALIAGGIALVVLIGLFFFFRRKPKVITYLFALMIGASLLGAPQADAKTVTYYGQGLGSGSYGDGGPFCGPCGAWVAYVGHVTYGVSAYISGTSNLINENDTVPAGTAIDFRPEFLSTYLDWFSTGGSIDSPYGIWTNNLGSIPGDNYGWAHQYPSVTYDHTGSTAGLSCNGSGSTCTVNSVGIIQTAVNYAATPWKSSFCGWGGPDCLRATASTPAQVITYPINVSPASNNPPNAPTIAGPTSGITGTSYDFSIQASDPNGDTLRYGIDWDNNGSVDQWSPGSGYVASNTIQTANSSWSSTNTYTFRALAQDNQGANSGWTTHTIAIANGGSSACILPAGSSTVDGTTAQIISVCGASAGTGYSSPADFNAASATVLQMDPSDYTVCHNNSSIPLLACSVGGGSGVDQFAWSGQSVCNQSYPTCAPSLTANLTINGSEGPLNVALGTPLSLSWSSTGASSCTAWGTGWGSGTGVATAGTSSTTATATNTYILQCTNGATSTTDSVQVTLTNSLKVCQNSCASGILRGTTSSTQSFTLARGGTQNLVSCFNPSSTCNDATGDVTTSTSWGEGGSNVVSLSSSSPKVVTGDNVGTEGISASYSGQTASMSATVTCLPTVSCDNAPGKENYCQNESFNVDNGCGVSISCTGTKTCNYNWKEVAP